MPSCLPTPCSGGAEDLRGSGKALPALERYGSTAATHTQLTRPFRRADIVRMPSVSGSYTLENWERLPRDGNRYELLDGELLVTPSPGPLHQTLVARLTVALASYVRSEERRCRERV